MLISKRSDQTPDWRDSKIFAMLFLRFSAFLIILLLMRESKKAKRDNAFEKRVAEGKDLEECRRKR